VLSEEVESSQATIGAQAALDAQLEMSFASMPMPVADFGVIAQRGDSISTILGTSDPVAIEAFMRANGLTDSTVYAGRTYSLPGEADYAASTDELGQRTLNQDNARLAMLAEITSLPMPVAQFASDASNPVARPPLLSAAGSALLPATEGPHSKLVDAPLLKGIRTGMDVTGNAGRMGGTFGSLD
jgi:hypothetical protein